MDCGSDITLHWTRNSGQEHDNTQLKSTKKTLKKQEGSVQDTKSVSGSPSWKSLGAKPKSESFPWEVGE